MSRIAGGRATQLELNARLSVFGQSSAKATAMLASLLCASTQVVLLDLEQLIGMYAAQSRYGRLCASQPMDPLMDIACSVISVITLVGVMAWQSSDLQLGHCFVPTPPYLSCSQSYQVDIPAATRMRAITLSRRTRDSVVCDPHLSDAIHLPTNDPLTT